MSSAGADATVFEKLSAIASNLWWSWQPEVVEVFRLLDPARFTEYSHNPVRLLQDFTPDQIEERAQDVVLHSRIHGAYRRFQEYMQAETTWGSTHCGVLGQGPVAYFSAEFGLHESLPIYSGGLGVLAGDHLKSASDLGIPLVAVGLYYHEGYFAQRISSDGQQSEEYPALPLSSLPLRPAEKNGRTLEISVETETGPIHARVLILQVGRITLHLLDTNIESNNAEDRNLTARLYSGDNRTRIRQELLLGVGGYRALRALGILPNVVHMNEGHCAFAPLEMIRRAISEDGLTFEKALQRTAAQCVFTTHTPVPAGHDEFSAELVKEHLGPLAKQLGLELKALMGLGRVDPLDTDEKFCMTVLALKMCRIANGVSSLHGVVSRQMWAGLWPWRSVEEVPIGHITNGVHVPTWLSAQMRVLYDRVLPVNWHTRTGEPEVWKDFESVDAAELWEIHQALKNRLISYARRDSAEQAVRRGADDATVERMRNVLDPKALTIGFARRFAKYKRADLILEDLDFLAKLVEDIEHPIQFVFAGKAHPRDAAGKEVLRKVFALTGKPPFAGRIVVLENYSIAMGRQLVQGVDVWLNNPRRPLEASGTSGQKVVLNGGLNCSILDGWWAEAFDGKNGFAIGNGRSHADDSEQDRRDGRALYQTLTEEVIPLYYDRDEDDLPQAWIARMKRAIRTLGWRFNADRMVMDYAAHTYVPAAGGLSRSIVPMP